MHCAVNALFSFYRSSIGKKWVVALTGLVLIGYIFGHLAGNLQVFGPPEVIHNYAAFLHSLGGWLWVARIVLIIALVLHVFTTIKLVVQNRAARPDRYAKKATVQATISSRTMALSGLLVFAFVVYHLLHFTFRTTDPRFHQLPRGEYDVHTMLVLGFENWWISGFYLLSVFLLAMHLSHGFSSLLQTFGLRSKGLANRIAWGGRALAWLIFLGYASIPIAVLAGYLKVVQP